MIEKKINYTFKLDKFFQNKQTNLYNCIFEEKNPLSRQFE